MISEVLEKHRHKLLKKSFVVAVGIGYKVKGGKKTDRLSIVCSVSKKLPLSLLKKKDIVPGKINDVITDVVETGTFRAPPQSQGIPSSIEKKRTDRWRPAPGGVSISHERVTSGTLGCLVKRDGEIFILSNNHVLANSNNAKIEDQALQPGTYFGGRLTQDMLARLADFIPIEFIGQEGCIGQALKLIGIKQQLENTVDAAIASPEINEGLSVKEEILEIGIPKGLNVTPELGLAIQKSGATTELTKGNIEQVNATVQVQYGEGKIAIFTNQIIAGAMCAGGDSGSAVLDMDKNLVGLLFAGSDNSTVINPIEYVFDLLNLTL